MTNPKPAIAPERKDKGYSLFWADASAVKQVLADEAVVQFTGDRVYLTVGQVQIPLGLALGDKLESLEIAPVARLVFTTDSYLKLTAALQGVAEQIRNSSKKAEGSR